MQYQEEKYFPRYKESEKKKKGKSHQKPEQLRFVIYIFLFVI